MNKLTERKIQALVIQWALFEKNHVYAIPGSTTLFAWEADVASITKSGYAHEFEIKISASDYKRDFEKTRKHEVLQGSFLKYRPCPAYFWYVTTGFEITPPEYAGWIEAKYNEKQCRYILSVRKEAPRIHSKKVDSSHIEQIAHLLSFRIASEMMRDLYAEATA